MSESLATEEYLDQLRSALTLKRDQREDVVDEIRSNLNAHVQSLMESGRPMEDARQRALNELGNPYELAHRMQKTMAPKSNKGVSALRYSLAVVIGLLGLWFFFQFRSWGPAGFNPVLCVGILGFFGPAILLAWPGIIWRRNWVFFIYPGALCLFFILLAVGTFGGTSSEQTMVLIPAVGVSNGLAVSSQEIVIAPPSGATVDPTATSRKLVSCAVLVVLGALIIATLAMVQRKQQRVGVVISMVVFCAIVEVPHQVEEALVRRKKEALVSYLGAYKAEHGVYPSEEVVRADNPRVMNRMHFRYDQERGDFTMFHPRWLNRNHSLSYASASDRWGWQD